MTDHPHPAAEPPSPIVAARSLSCGYGKRPVLRNVSFALAPGQVHGLIGANGVGKTTLLRTPANCLPPASSPSSAPAPSIIRR